MARPRTGRERIESGVPGNQSPTFLPDDVRTVLTALVGHLQK